MVRSEWRRLNFRRSLSAVVLLCLFSFSIAAGAAWAKGRFVLNHDRTITDTKTGLMWQQEDNGSQMGWEAATDEVTGYCVRLALGGYDDWRVPRIDELETIINYATYDPAGFDLPSYGPFWTSSYYYWSSSAYVYRPIQAWVVDFNDGYAIADLKTSNNYVRCVRSGPFWPLNPSTDFQTPAEKPDVVLDTRWGYMWQKGDSGDTPLNWADGNATCARLRLDGYDDWRLPEIEALEIIVNYTTFDPALSEPFNPRRSYNYWSSSTYVNYPDYAWDVNFNSGYVYAHDKTGSNNYVRCVRSGSWSLVPLTVNKLGSRAGRVTSDPTRIDCWTNCPTQTANFPDLTQIVLTAHADAGSVFVGWDGGGCSGTGGCLLTMGTDPVTVTANFVRGGQAVPALSGWGLLLFALSLSAVAYWARKRKLNT